MRYPLLSVAAQLAGLALVFTEPSPTLKIAGGAVSLLALGWALRTPKRSPVTSAPVASADEVPSVASEVSSGPATAAPSDESPSLRALEDVPVEPDRDSAIVVREVLPAGASDLKLALLRAMIEDKTGFYEFYREARCRLGELSAGTLAGQAAGETLFTLARTSWLWGLSALAQGAEQALQSLWPNARGSAASKNTRGEGFTLSAEGLAPLGAAFRELEETLAAANGHEPDEVLEIAFGAFDALVEHSRSSPERSLAHLERLRQEPTRQRFRKLRAYAEQAATAQGKARPEVEIRDGELLLARERFSAVWAGVLHLIDNSLEHAFESGEERRALGKPPKGQLSLRSRAEDSKIILEVSDDGRGIDWSVVAERARQSKLRAATRDDLVAALLSGKLEGPTRPSLGLSALQAACQELHGSVTVVSSKGRGTTFRISLPLRNNLAMFVPSLSPGADTRAPAPLAFVHNPVRISEHS